MRSTLGWLLAAWRANLASALEYRASFLLQAGFMAANNFLFLAFWAVFFARFETLGGWELRDVALLYGVVATAFGLSVVLFGGTFDLARRISEGRLDTWLLRGRPLFLQAATARMSVAGYGDVATGLALLVLSGNAQPRRLAAFVVAVGLSLCAFVAFCTALNAVAFYARRAEGLAQQGMHGLLAFAMYPPGLFGGWSRVLLYVLIPAGLVGWTPAALVREWSWSLAGGLGLGVGLLVAGSALVWRCGIRRYESGNLTQVLEA